MKTSDITARHEYAAYGQVLLSGSRSEPFTEIWPPMTFEQAKRKVDAFIEIAKQREGYRGISITARTNRSDGTISVISKTVFA